MVAAARLFLLTPVLSEAAPFRPALEEALSERVDCVLVRRSATLRRDDLATLIGCIQAVGAAALIEGEPREAARVGADGVHLPAGTGGLSDALQALKPNRIVGVGATASRDEAMSAGEAGVDYLMFGEPRPDGYVPPLLMTLDQARWWAEVFTVPCVAYAQSLEDVWPLVEGFDAQRILGDQSDLVQRRLFEVAAGGFVHRILPDAERAVGHQRLGDAAGITVHLRQLPLGNADDDFILAGDDLEQGHLLGGIGRMNHDVFHDAGEAQAESQASQQAFCDVHV